MSVAGIPNLEAFLLAMGKGYVFVGDLETAGGLEALGATEGDINVEMNDTYNDLQFPEYTGDAIHERRVLGQNPVVTIPLIIGNPDLWAVVSPTGLKGGGYTDQQPPTETSLVIFSEDDLRDGVAYDNATSTWTPAANTVEQSFFAWRGHFTQPGLTYRSPDGGKVIQEVNFQVMQGPVHIVDGYKLYALGGTAAVAANPNLDI